MAKLSVTLSEQRSPGNVRRSLAVAGKDVWWDISGPDDILPPRLERSDIAVAAAAMFAMHQGVDLHVDGAVSRSLLERMEDYVACWCVWRPDLFRRIEITATEELGREAAAADSRAVVAFSGGLDASSTVWRHKTGMVGRRSRQLALGVLVQGFDIPLGKDEAFERAADTARQTLASVAVPLAVLRTNWRSVLSVDWEMEFGSAAAACLRNWQGAVGTALLGSDEDYSRLMLPWGGNPITYAMLSSDGFEIVYDGGEFSRTEKAGQIRDWDIGLKNLRVCWQGPVTGGNCGSCEKCLRTKMNFLGNGLPVPPSLHGDPSAAEILGLRARGAVHVALLAEIASIAAARGETAPWLFALRATIFKNRLLNALHHH